MACFTQPNTSAGKSLASAVGCCDVSNLKLYRAVVRQTLLFAATGLPVRAATFK
tara:strand:+ start:2052 stop:2213 length:162 start_codon:yes stop_codon:yes gene_type:complete